VDVATHGVNMGDLYLMCSDGLSDMLDAPSIGEMLAAGHDLPELAALLVDGAKARGGRDNITVLLAQAGSSPTGLMARLFGKP